MALLATRGTGKRGCVNICGGVGRGAGDRDANAEQWFYDSWPEARQQSVCNFQGKVAHTRATEYQVFKMMKQIRILAVALLFSASASAANLGPTYTFEEIEVVNNSKQPISDLTIRVAGSDDGSDRVFSCESIIALGICQKRFSRVRYKEGGFVVDWVAGDSDRKTAEIGVKVPAYSSPGIPLSLEFSISAEGEMTAKFKQHTPLR
jgi:hypothetical protein